MTGEKLLLTGATGHLGQSLAALLVAAGHHVIGIGRRASVLRRLEEITGPGSFVGVECDLAGAEPIDAMVTAHGPFSTLIHAAAAVDEKTSPREIYQQNVVSTAILLEKLMGRVQYVIYLSSIDVYGLPDTCPISEEHPTRPATFYGASKLAGEEYVRLFGRDAGIPTVMVRLSSIYGPGEQLHRAMLAFLKAAIANKPIALFGDGSDLRDYIYVDDAAEGIRTVLEHRLEGTYNLGGGSPVSIRELAANAQSLTGSYVGIEEKPRMKPRYDLYLDISKLSRSTAFRPRTSLRDGMANEVEALLGGRGKTA